MGQASSWGGKAVREARNVLFWSVIAAAFIGPGTVTTAALAGQRHGLELAWVLGIAVVACFVLQEAVSRLTILTGQPLGRLMAASVASSIAGTPHSPATLRIAWVIFAGLGTGCAAYEAGNLLGALSGLQLLFPLPPSVGLLVLCAIVGGILWSGSYRMVSQAMGVLVALMGVAFLYTAIAAGGQEAAPVIQHAAQATPQAGLLAAGLVGTTIVPYNLFLGSGLSAGKTLGEMRRGLAISVGLGGLISFAILLTGRAISPGSPFSFQALADVLGRQVAGGQWLLAVGLFAAGLSSAITAPMAAALTALNTLPETAFHAEKSENGQKRLYIGTWAVVLLTGLGFGLTGASPTWVIVLAQVFNGLLLPGITAMVLMLLNGQPDRAGGMLASRLALSAIFLLTLFLGLSNILKGFSAIVPQLAGISPWWAVALTLPLGLWVLWRVQRRVQRRVQWRVK